MKNNYPDHWISISSVIMRLVWHGMRRQICFNAIPLSTMLHAWLCNGEDVNWIRCLHICPPLIHLHIYPGRHPLSFCTSSPIRWTNRTFEAKEQELGLICLHAKHCPEAEFIAVGSIIRCAYIVPELSNQMSIMLLTPLIQICFSDCKGWIILILNH